MYSKKRYILGLLLFFLSSYANGQLVELDWVSTMGGGLYEEGKNIAIDAIGNVYTSGSFRGTVDFDPGPGVFYLTAHSSYQNIFIQKQDPFGNLVWAKSIGELIGDEEIQSLAVDSVGNVYATGYFRGTVDFDPDMGVSNLTAGTTASDIFILKLDTGGSLTWVKRVGGTDVDYGQAITVDNTGNIYTIGQFRGTVDFNPNVGISNLTAVGQDIFILKLNSSGSFIWAKRIGRNNANEAAYTIAVDDNGYLFTTGYFEGITDFDPNLGTYFLNTIGAGAGAFVLKLTTSGNFVWAKSFGGSGEAITVDGFGNVYTLGHFGGTVDLDPNPAATNNVVSVGPRDIFIQKLDSLGNFCWGKSMGGTSWDSGRSITVDKVGNVYSSGYFTETVDFNPNIGTYFLSAPDGTDGFIQKLDVLGNFVWALPLGGSSVGGSCSNSIVLDDNGDIYTTGYFRETIDFNPNSGTQNVTAVNYSDIYVRKLKQNNVTGLVFYDINQNCVQDASEIGIVGRNLLITPGNIVVTTSENGRWGLDFLSAGSYNIVIDTTGKWISTCQSIQSFTIMDSDSFTTASSFGLFSTSPCVAPDISIHAPFLRPGFSNQKVYVQACNEDIGTATLDSAYVILELDSMITVQSSSLPYSDLGNNLYRVNVDTIYPGFCVNFWLNCHLSSNAVQGQSLCLKASLYPVDSCSLDSLPNPSPLGITPCNTVYDYSHLVIRPSCNNDTINFVITNLGDGDMSCFSQVRLYVDGIYIWMDSIQLVSGDTATFTFSGDGRTFRLEVDQHPLHYGNSQPSASIELCGNASNWTSNLINLLPQNDADPVVDIFCGIVTGSFDPNDKTGFPLGIDSTHNILSNRELEYLIRFQNTGTDTAFTVIIRDTLTTDLEVFSVRSGVASHGYTFKMYGPRILEWTFDNIMLPDSNVNEIESHGFITFKVDQKANLPVGTVIENSAAIYFDFNPPIITNSYQHTIDTIKIPDWNNRDTITPSVCDSFSYRDLTYTNPGLYWQIVNDNGIDSIHTINLTFLNSYYSFLVNSCDSFDLNGQVYTTSGSYSQRISNAVGCDSIITLDLTIGNNISTLNEIVCGNYTSPDGQIYTSSGQYVAIVSNSLGCDSIITINLVLDSLGDNNVTQNGTIISTNANGFIYQWLDCNNNYLPILGEINQSFTPTINGRFAVVITNGICVDTSNCLDITQTAISKFEKELGILIYPIPTSSVLNIDKKKNSEISINIMDHLGRVLISKTSNKPITKIDLDDFAIGIYYIYVNNGTQTAVQKIVKGVR